ncbi:Predicted arabinose efflux permease, MFS family [Pedococcus dokdonensis]|uniref:Predicted arabinose efflux permease, MFS family n=1 Tax=Pedococcus dokdonensis TaxID=443156 RepID=A0A1H0RX91_9MICO|nr:MFS transporter [Pedococcus dokdonensis]SDP33568.1 Predicted arabinose efflux permease, MFS family [Pedococcus dokdonensis]
MDGEQRALVLLREREFAVLFSARTLSMLAIAFAPVALAFGILDLPGATATTLSVVLAAESVAIVVFVLAGGVVADRYPRHRILQLAEWVNAAAHLALALMVMTRHAPTAGLAAAAAVSGTATAMVWPALTGIVPDVVPAAGLQQGNALLGLGGNIARVAGLVAGGVLVVAVGAGWSLVVAAALFLAGGALVSRLRPRWSSARDSSGSVLADLREGWVEFRSRQWLWVVVVQFSVLVMVWQAAHLVLGPVVAKQELGGPAAWTAVLTGESVGLIVGVLIALRWRPRRPILAVTLISFGAAPPYLLLGGHAPLWTVVLAAFVLGLCFDLFTVLWQTTIQREVPASAVSRVSSYDELGSLLLGPIGLLLAGPAAARFGAHPALVVCGLVMVATTLFALCFPSVRNLTSKGPAAPTGAARGVPGLVP